MGCPARRIKSGFGSNKSTWLGPPDMKRKITRRARGAKCGAFGASGFGKGDAWRSEAPAASRPSCSKSEASASRPSPPPARPRNSRRVVGRVAEAVGPPQVCRASINIDKSVEVKQNSAKFPERRSLQKLGGATRFLLRRRSTQDQPISPLYCWL